MPQDDEAKRTTWARRAAERFIDGVVTASEGLSAVDQAALLREMARRALWHMPNSRDEVRELVRHFDIENLRQPNPFDDDPPGG